MNPLGGSVRCEVLYEVNAPYHYIGSSLENVLEGASQGDNSLASHLEEAVTTEGGQLLHRTARGEKRTPEVQVLLDSPGILSHISPFLSSPDVQTCRHADALMRGTRQDEFSVRQAG